jgi:hypothetical protein
MNSLIIDCETCVARASGACQDCVVTYFVDGADDRPALVFDLATERAVRLFAQAGMVPTLRHRAAASE